VSDSSTEDVKSKTSLWGSIVTIVAGVLIIGLTVTTIHYRDLYVQTLDRLRSVEFRRQALEEDASNFRFRKADSSAYVLQLEPTLTVAEIGFLQQKGLWDPYTDIANDLINHPELISLDSAGEGEAPVLIREGVCVLGPDRVLAFFEHGNRQGKMLLSYTVSDDGEIRWEVQEAAELE